MKKFSIVLGTLLLISCEKEIDYKIPDPGKKIVIDTRLVSGENAVAMVGTSVYSMSKERPGTNGNVKVALYRDGIFQDSMLPRFNQNIAQWVYESNNHIIEPQKSYTIRANYSSLPEAIASDRIPPPVYTNLFNTEFTSATINGNVYSIPTGFSFKILDNPATEDYYRISLSQRNGTPPVLFSSTNPVLTDFFNNFDFEGNGERRYFYFAYLSDKDLVNAASTFNILVEEEVINDLYLCLDHISKDYYEHERTKALAYFGGDGFSEPVQIHSNVTNGYGIVAGTTPTTTKIEP